jgi:hypothetical protein
MSVKDEYKALEAKIEVVRSSLIDAERGTMGIPNDDARIAKLRDKLRPLEQRRDEILRSWGLLYWGLL